jgi:GrpB-like predicted nucleotidyltransferase (UPF0157 family)
MIDALKLVLRDKLRDLEEIRQEKARVREQLDELETEEMETAYYVADLEKHIAEIEREDVN